MVVDYLYAASCWPSTVTAASWALAGNEAPSCAHSGLPWHIPPPSSIEHITTTTRAPPLGIILPTLFSQWTDYSSIVIMGVTFQPPRQTCLFHHHKLMEDGWICYHVFRWHQRSLILIIITAQCLPLQTNMVSIWVFNCFCGQIYDS